MSRAFMFEKDDMFHCEVRDKDCKHANLRGGCDLDRCVDDEVNHTLTQTNPASETGQGDNQPQGKKS